MKNKKQEIKYIDGRWCDTVNDYYLKDGWQVVSIHPVASKDQIGAYVLLEKINENELGETLKDLGISVYEPDGTIKTMNKVLNEAAETWEGGLYL